MDRKTFLTTSTLATATLFFFGMGTYSAKDLMESSEEMLPDSEELSEVIIVGSGYGGAVAALRLCEQNIKVTILEMGLNWQKHEEKFSPMINPGHSAAWLKTRTVAPFLNIFKLEKFTGVLDRLDFEHIKIWVGRGVGGGSIVNGGMAVTPKRSYFEEIFPKLNSEDFYSKYFPLANKELKTNTASEEFLERCDYYKFSRVGEMEAKKAGFKTVRVPNVYDFKYMEDEYDGKVPKSALDGEVIYGNNHGKNSLDKTYLKKALATGNLEILDLHQVNSLEKNSDNTYTIDVTKINTKGEKVQSKIFKTKKVFLAAGTMGSTELLLKSKAKANLQLDENVGKDFGNNGNFMTGRNWVQAFSGGTGLKQSTIPVGAIDHFDDEEHPFFTEIAPLPMGLNVATILYLMVNKLKKTGAIFYDQKTDAIQLNWDKSHTDHMKKNAKFFLRTMNNENGGTRSHMLFNNGFGEDICYHPLGGLVLGKATDQFGRLNKHPNVYVVDGSLIPGTIGVNPFVTITAIAEYCVENIIKEDFA